MNQVVLRPPPGRWLRYTQAAAACGLAPRQYLDLVQRDASIRVQHLGKRGLLHVASEDADALKRRLEMGAPR